MNSGTVAEQSGVPVKTIRYYETIELIAPAQRDRVNDASPQGVLANAEWQGPNSLDTAA